MSPCVVFYLDFCLRFLSSLFRAEGPLRLGGIAMSVALVIVCNAIVCSTIGCNRSNPYLTASPSGFSAPSSLAANIASPQFSAQITELERRAKLLDDNNRQLTTQLAQSQQQMQLFKERAELMQRQVQDVGNQLQQSRMANVQSSQQLRERND